VSARRAAAPLAIALVSACVAPAPPSEPAPAARPAPVAAPRLAESEFVVEGAFEQGGWVRGTAPRNTARLLLAGRPVALAADGRFFAGFDRDAPAQLALTAVSASGEQITRALRIAPRDWPIERVNVPLRGTIPSEAFMAIRRPELAAIAAARAVRHDSEGWRQRFVWPVKGRISGRFGAQRIYQGVPGSYHSGLDIAPGDGAAYVAPADGVVVLAAEKPFTLEGYLLIVDHGMGLTSAFLHSSRLAVRKGDRVRQGQLLGYVGATGRASGPHLHWGLKWDDARLDPLLFLPPQ
jgi:murein DD-endopeptidase MepM/ murein hydrolase activator NlpD